jgi:ATP-binding cassette subfamily F protein 1
LFEQEVVADDTPAIQAILKADVNRTALLEEADKLEIEQGKGNLKVYIVHKNNKHVGLHFFFNQTYFHFTGHRTIKPSI